MDMLHQLLRAALLDPPVSPRMAGALVAGIVACGVTAARARQRHWMAIMAEWRDRLRRRWRPGTARRGRQTQDLPADRELARLQGLLAAFEESGHGWLWETDHAGRLRYISWRFAQGLGRNIAEVLDRRLVDVVANRAEEATAGPGLGVLLIARLPFSNLMVEADIGDRRRAWSLSGKPVFDKAKRFIGFRGIGTDLTERLRSEAQISRLAHYDSLTDLPNRVLMRQTLDGALHKPGRGEAVCAIFLIDLDRFKSVNDSLGHPIGDALLRQVGKRLGAAVGAAGCVGRLGGDEFKVVLPGLADRARLSALAIDVIASLSQPYSIEAVTIRIGASIGIAVSPGDGDAADALIRNADLALYAAKADGKGVHRFYEAAMHSDAEDRRLLEIDLRTALEENGLELAFQPVVDTRSKAIVGFEALARWHHPTRGEVAPALFIPIAEELGLIPRIGEWVIRTACAEAVRWPEAIRIAVNLSPLQFANPGLTGIIVNTLAATQLRPDRLELEITEGVFLRKDAATDAILARLKGLGVRLALDDFGTGYSSLGYLTDAPFDKIKIDQSFVRGAAVASGRKAAILRAIVALAHGLAMETTAEGVETEEEFELVRGLGCSQAQGYVFGRPMAAEAALALITDGAAKAAMVGAPGRERGSHKVIPIAAHGR